MLTACFLAVVYWFADTGDRSGPLWETFDDFGAGGTAPPKVSGLGSFGAGGTAPSRVFGLDSFGAGGTAPSRVSGLDSFGAGGTAPSRVSGLDSFGAGGTGPSGLDSLAGNAPARPRMPVEVDSALGDRNAVREGMRITLPAPEGRSLHGVVDSISRPGGERSVLRGQIDETPFGHFTIAIDPEGRQVASVHLNEWNQEYFVRHDPGTDSHVLRVIDLDDLPEYAPCETCSRHMETESSGIDFESSDSDEGSETGTVDSDALDLTVIDVMVVYTPAAMSWADDKDDGIEAVVLDAMARAQFAMDNSEGLVEFRLVHSAFVDYVEDGDAETDLLRLTETHDEWAGYLNEVHEWRDQYGADLVSMFVGENVNYGGVAWILQEIEGDPGGGFSISRVTQAALHYTHAHEMGHNLGLAHDVANAGVDGLFDYSYGWRWTGSDDEEYRSVMAYLPGARVPFFSNPDVSHLGAPTGDAEFADNARTIRESRHVIAGYRDPAAEAVALALSGSTETLQAGETRVFSATLKDADGEVVLSGADSELVVDFRKVAGEGAITGLGTVTAVNGVASLTITGGTVTGPVVFEASATSLNGELLVDETEFEVAIRTVASGETAEVGSLLYADGEIAIAEGGVLAAESLTVLEGGVLVVSGGGSLRVTDLMLGPNASQFTAGSMEVEGVLELSSGGMLFTDGNLKIGSEAAGVVLYGTVEAGSLTILPGGALEIDHGGLVLGGDGLASEIAGRLAFFHSLGSIEFNGDVTISGKVFGLISDVHAAEGVQVTVVSGGELTFDGCLIDAPGSGFGLGIAGGGAFTMARSVFENGEIALDSGAVDIRDNLFFVAGVEVGAGGDGAAVYHNIADDLAGFLTVAEGVGVITEVDGWGNVEDRNQTENDLVLEWRAEGLGSGRTLDGKGNLFVQPGDFVETGVEIGALSGAVDGVSLVMGYSRDYLMGPVLSAGEDWSDQTSLIAEEDALGRVNASLEYGNSGGTEAGGEVAQLSFVAGPLEGRTLVFFRVPRPIDLANGFSEIALLETDTEDVLTPFSVNSGYLTIDGTPPQIATGGTVEQDQNGLRDMTGPGEVVEQGVLVVSFEAFDALAGIDESGVSVTFAGQGALEGESFTGVLTDSSETVWIGEDAYTRYWFETPITAETLNGTYAVWASVRDRSGNTTEANLGEVTVNKNEIDVDIALQGFTAGTDAAPLTVEVTFVFTDTEGTELEERVMPVILGSANLDAFTFKRVPDGTAHVSAKAPKHLRRRLPAEMDAHGQGAVSFTEGMRLLGGDLNGTNRVRSPDLSILSTYWLQNVSENPAAAAADINGDGRVRSQDLSILQSNWLADGDPR